MGDGSLKIMSGKSDYSKMDRELFGPDISALDQIDFFYLLTNFSKIYKMETTLIIIVITTASMNRSRAFFFIKKDG